jgi:flavin-dependent dehydrogenase
MTTPLTRLVPPLLRCHRASCTERALARMTERGQPPSRDVLVHARLHLSLLLNATLLGSVEKGCYVISLLRLAAWIRSVAAENGVEFSSGFTCVALVRAGYGPVRSVRLTLGWTDRSDE